MSIEIIVLASVVLLLTVVAVVQSVQLHQAHLREQAMSGQPKPIKVPEPTVAELEARLKAAYEAQISSTAEVFGNDLKATSARLGEQVSRLTTTVIEDELAAYQKTLTEVRQSANEAMEKIHAAVEQQRIELKQGMEADLAAERQRMIDRFNTRLGDIVASYISESLGSGVDLGAQMQYILNSLEKHKDEITKDLQGGV